ncbi:MAG: hypothetical protein QOF98_439 [Streptomyces sp.]|nr:hypothetical protein [Streptomyces sp.]
MDELDAVRELRADAPTLDTARQVGGHWTLMAAIAAETELEGTARRRRNWYPPRVALRPLIAAGAAAAIVSGILVALPSSSDRDQPRTAATILAEAAAYAESQTVPKPAPNQWVFQDTVSCQLGCELQPVWDRADGSLWAVPDQIYGKPFTTLKLRTEKPWYNDPMRFDPRKAYDLLAALPTDPQKLLDKVSTDRAFNSTAGYEKVTPTRQFDIIVDILQNAAVIPAKVNAALYRALALIPGAKLLDKPGKDAYGRTTTTIEFHLTYTSEEPVLPTTSTGKVDLKRLNDPNAPTKTVETHFTAYLYLDPETYAYLGYRDVTEPDATGKGAPTEKARKSAAIVSKAGLTADGTSWKPYPLPAWDGLPAQK